MGYGGNLMWTGVIKALHKIDKKKILICKKPNLSDLFSLRIYDGYESYKDDHIFKENPRVRFNIPFNKKKPILFCCIDNGFKVFLKVKILNSIFEKTLHIFTKYYFKKTRQRIVLMNLQKYSYAKSQTKKQILWKRSSHAIQAIADNFNLPLIEITTELNFTDDENINVKKILNANNVSKKFIIFEPDSNTKWFGILRMWPKKNWNVLIKSIQKHYPDLCIVHIGEKKITSFNNIVNLTGKTTFREAALIIKHSALFICTEGGLMHAARAVEANTLVIWGGITKPSFAGYINKHTIVSENVACSPCGNLGWCNNDHICMNNIQPDTVLKKTIQLLNKI